LLGFALAGFEGLAQLDETLPDLIGHRLAIGGSLGNSGAVGADGRASEARAGVAAAASMPEPAVRGLAIAAMVAVALAASVVACLARQPLRDGAHALPPRERARGADFCSQGGSRSRPKSGHRDP
jgi:hypothetical protein